MTKYQRYLSREHLNLKGSFCSRTGMDLFITNLMGKVGVQPMSKKNKDSS